MGQCCISSQVPGSSTQHLDGSNRVDIFRVFRSSDEDQPRSQIPSSVTSSEQDEGFYFETAIIGEDKNRHRHDSMNLLNGQASGSEKPVDLQEARSGMSSRSSGREEIQHKGSRDGNETPTPISGDIKSSLNDPPPYMARENESLVFEAAIQPDRGAQIYLGGETAKRSILNAGPGNAVRLYDLPAEQAWQMTRRLCTGLSTNSSTTVYEEFWLPLADLRLKVHGETIVVLSWSDCNQDIARPTQDYEERHDRVYRRQHPNNALLLHFLQQEQAQEFVAILRSPSEELLRAQQRFESFPLVGGKVVAQPFTLNAKSAPIKGFVVKGKDVEKISTSRLYLLPPHLDFLLQTKSSETLSGTPSESALGYVVVIKPIQTPNYLSRLEGLHQSATEVGYCRKISLEVVQAELAFEQTKGSSDIHQRYTLGQILS